ncbi:MAG: enoyl-CoA hydratase [Hyphomonadaceae bacterium]
MSDAAEPILLVEHDGPVAIVTLNRPKQLNAMSVALRSELVTTIRTLAADDNVCAIVLTGNGRAFTAGVDLKEAGQQGFSLGVGGDGDCEGDARAPDLDLAAAFAACPQPVIGAINGFAITGGFELALMCDLLLASSEAKFADTHGRVGLMPVWGLSQNLSRRIGLARAKELSLTGNFLDAETAERWGLVNRVVAPDELLPAARKLAHEMAQIDGDLLRRLKAVIDEGSALALPDALRMEIMVGNAYNAGVTPEAAESSRKAVMERGREQKG